MKGFLNSLVGFLEGVAKLLGLKWCIEVTDHKIEVEFVDPDDKSKREFNENHFTNGNIYIKGYSNPVNISKAKDKLDLVSSDRYKDFMNGELRKGLMHINPEGWTTKKLVMVVMVLTAINTSIIGLFLFLMMGGM